MKELAITNDRHLLSILKIEKDELNHILSSTHKLYNGFIQKKKKKDGTIKERPICEPKEPLKTLQSRLKDNLFSKYKLPDYIQGGIKGKDSITNSKIHQGKNFHFCLDLKNFFPSVKNARVNKVLLGLGYKPNIASAITKLTTCTLSNKFVNLNREVPQGAPTSTCITNLVFYSEVDIEIDALIRGKGITYTRYVDDLNFSSQSDFIDTVYQIVRIISDANFKINRKKTFYKKGKVEITGNQVCQNALQPPERLKEKLKEADRSEKSKAGVLNHIKRIKNA